MGYKIKTILLMLIQVMVVNSFSGVCYELSVSRCCVNYILRDGKCTECPRGLFGVNCSSVCPTGYFGRFCEQICRCHPDYCKPVSGCIFEDKQAEEITLKPSVIHNRITRQRGKETSIKSGITTTEYIATTEILTTWKKQHETTSKEYKSKTGIISTLKDEHRSYRDTTGTECKPTTEKTSNRKDQQTNKPTTEKTSNRKDKSFQYYIVSSPDDSTSGKDTSKETVNFEINTQSLDVQADTEDHTKWITLSAVLSSFTLISLILIIVLIYKLKSAKKRHQSLELAGSSKEFKTEQDQAQEGRGGINESGRISQENPYLEIVSVMEEFPYFEPVLESMAGDTRSGDSDDIIYLEPISVEGD